MNEVLKAISAAPQIIAELETNNLVIKQQISETKDTMDGIKKSTWAEVASEKDENGKKAFPNADLRDAEVERRLSESDQYQKCVLSLKAFEGARAKNEIELQQVNNQFSVDRYRIRLYTAEKIQSAALAFNQGINTLHSLGSLLTSIKTPQEAAPMQDECPF